MMKQNSYIYSIEGKDIILAGDKGYNTKKGKRYKGALDYSLLALKINELDDTAFFMGEKKDANKQFTKAIVNLTFEYAVKEFNIEYIDKNKVYVKLGADTSNLIFENGVAIIKDEVVAVIVDKYVKIVEGELLEIIKDELLDAKGFSFVVNKKNQIKWTVDTSKFKTIINAEEIRTQLYEEGFSIDGIGYSRFIRSTGSSRQGKCLFVRNDLLQPLNDWLYMGLKFKNDEPVDLPALESYIALVTSSIIDTIQILPENILIIDSFESIFTDKVMETKIINGKLLSDINDNMEIKNKIWDGQSLMDSSLFGIVPNENMTWVVGKYYDKSVLLTRGRFFKSACFNTNIQNYFSDNSITDVSQLNGFTLAQDLSAIKLITTKDSIKFCKFGTLEEWLSKIEDTFGIVKYEKPTHFFDGDLVQTHYQLLNTMQLSLTDIKELIQPNIDYLKGLKSDIRVFRHHVKTKIKSNIDAGDINKTDEMIYTMLQVNNEFLNTPQFQSYRQDIIDAYVKNMRQGHILLPGTYSVLFGNPLSMLKHSIGKFDGQAEFGVDECVCKYFDAEAEDEIICARSPHITMANIWKCKIVVNSDIDAYFNLSKNIVCVNSIGNNLLQRMNGSDFDIDAIAMIKSEIFKNAYEKNHNNFLVPTHNIEGEPPEKKYNTSKDKAVLDIATDNDLIGRIVNCSQVGNSIIWHILNGNSNITDVQDIYKDVCTLSVMSGLAIDSAKKTFPIPLEDELEDISSKFKAIISKMFGESVRPMFFKYTMEKKYLQQSNYIFKKFNTSMDFLQTAINGGIKAIANRKGRANVNNNNFVPLAKLLNKNNSIKIADANYNQITNIVDIVGKYKKDGDSIWNDNNKSSEQKYEEYKQLTQKVYAEISDLEILDSTVKKIVNDMAKGKYPSIERKLLSVMYSCKKDVFINLFTTNRDNVCSLKRARNENDYDVILFGIKFKTFRLIA